jgi:hypothetical protein
VVANVCVGCGFTVDAQGRLVPDVAAWPLPCDPDESPFRQPVGCGTDGRLWAPPRQVVMTDLFTGTNTAGLVYTAPANQNPNGFCRTFSLTITNPDPCRRMHGVALIEIDARVNLIPNSEFRVEAVNGNDAQRIRNDSAQTRQPFCEFTRNLTVSIPPGGTQTLTWEVCLATSPTTGSDLVSIANTVRIMAVSSQPA